MRRGSRLCRTGAPCSCGSSRAVQHLRRFRGESGQHRVQPLRVHRRRRAYAQASRAVRMDRRRYAATRPAEVPPDEAEFVIRRSPSFSASSRSGNAVIFEEAMDERDRALVHPTLGAARETAAANRPNPPPDRLSSSRCVAWIHRSASSREPASDGAKIRRLGHCAEHPLQLLCLCAVEYTLVTLDDTGNAKLSKRPLHSRDASRLVRQSTAMCRGRIILASELRSRPNELHDVAGRSPR